MSHKASQKRAYAAYCRLDGDGFSKPGRPSWHLLRGGSAKSRAKERA
jgi:hypothetical protein